MSQTAAAPLPRDERLANAKALLIMLAIIVALLLSAYRPATVVGVHAGPLANSVGGGGGGIVEPSCTHLGGDDWRCSALDREGSSTATYFVTTDRFGCWKIGNQTVRRGNKRSGCITAFDWLF